MILAVKYHYFWPPYGMVMQNRTLSNGNYRYSFQGQEHDDEVKGTGNSINYKYRMHDPRIGRFFAVDPLAPKYPELTPYQFSSNSPIFMNEIEGLEGQVNVYNNSGSGPKYDKEQSYKDPNLNQDINRTDNWENGKRTSVEIKTTGGDPIIEYSKLEHYNASQINRLANPVLNSPLDGSKGFTWIENEENFTRNFNDLLRQNGNTTLAAWGDAFGGIRLAILDKLQVANPYAWGRAYDGMVDNVSNAFERSTADDISFFSAYGANAIQKEIQFFESADALSWWRAGSGKAMDLAGGIYGGVLASKTPMSFTTSPYQKAIVKTPFNKLNGRYIDGFYVGKYRFQYHSHKINGQGPFPHVNFGKNGAYHMFYDGSIIKATGTK